MIQLRATDTGASFAWLRLSETSNLTNAKVFKAGEFVVAWHASDLL